MTAQTETTLLADIGGTSARFALLAGGAIGDIVTLAVADHASPVEAARAFLAKAGHQPQAACIAAAGPVVSGRVTMVNAAWTIDAEDIRHGLGLRAARVINDFEALGWSLPGLRADDVVVIGEVDPPDSGTKVVMGPGTGFGLAALATDGNAEVVLVTEGGHATLPAENRREDTIIEALREHAAHVSVERALSGPGLVALYQAIADIDAVTAPQRSAADIVEHALRGDCATSRNTLDAFCGFLGSVAGNAALTLGALGGVFIAGGIVPRFTGYLKQSAFRTRFEAKGRLAPYMAHVATSVIVHPNPAFVGLARLASSGMR
jgi:glucokinase